jgi:hypothetical protein
MRRSWIAALLLLSSATAYAQEEEESAPLSAAPIEEKKGSAFAEVEHGFYVGASTGIAIGVSPGGNVYTADDRGALSSSKAGLALGQSGGIELGIEPTPLLSIGVLAWGSAANTPARYYGTCDPTIAGAACPRGNTTSLLLGANARLNLSLGPDANDVRRSFFFVRVGAGYAILSPKGLLANEPVVFGGPGFEYFTHLRHFSVGIEAVASFGLTNKGLGVQVSPLVRYTF